MEGWRRLQKRGFFVQPRPPEGMAGGVLSRQILRGLGDRDLPSTHAVNSLRRYFVPLGAQMMSGSGGAECEFHRSACWCRDPVFPSALPRSRLSEMEPAYPAALSEPGAWSAPAADTPRLRGPRSRGQFKLDLRLDPCPLPAHDGQSALVGAEDSAGIAEPVGRAETIGRPWLWRLRERVDG
jgi:hypothetical protein